MYFFFLFAAGLLCVALGQVVEAKLGPFSPRTSGRKRKQLDEDNQPVTSPNGKQRMTRMMSNPTEPAIDSPDAKSGKGTNNAKTHSQITPISSKLLAARGGEEIARTHISPKVDPMIVPTQTSGQSKEEALESSLQSPKAKRSLARKVSASTFLPEPMSPPRPSKEVILEPPNQKKIYKSAKLMGRKMSKWVRLPQDMVDEVEAKVLQESEVTTPRLRRPSTKRRLPFFDTPKLAAEAASAASAGAEGAVVASKVAILSKSNFGADPSRTNLAQSADWGISCQAPFVLVALTAMAFSCLRFFTKSTSQKVKIPQSLLG